MISQINKNFLIRYKEDFAKKTSLIGAGKYHLLVESKEMANNHFQKVLKSNKDKVTIKLRRGLKIDFVSK